MISCKVMVLNLVESFSMIYLGIYLFKLTVTPKRILGTGILYALSIYGVRNIYELFNLPLGTHSVILLGLFVIYCILICKLSVVQAVAIAYGSFTLIILGEWVFTAPLLSKLNLLVDQDFYSTWQGISVGLTANIFLVAATLILYVIRTVEKCKRLSI